MKKKFAVADLPEVRLELQKLVNAEIRMLLESTTKIKAPRKKSASSHNFHGMGFMIGGAA
jgi:hypothetical protein